MSILRSIFIRNWKTTITGLITGGALGYAGYSTGNPELLIAGVTAAAGGIIGKDVTTKRKKVKTNATKRRNRAEGKRAEDGTR